MMWEVSAAIFTLTTLYFIAHAVIDRKEKSSQRLALAFVVVFGAGSAAMYLAALL